MGSEGVRPWGVRRSSAAQEVRSRCWEFGRLELKELGRLKGRPLEEFGWLEGFGRSSVGRSSTDGRPLRSSAAERPEEARLRPG